MAGFCVNCGAPLAGAFCNKCGAKAISGSAPIQPSPVQPGPVAPAAFQPEVQPFSPEPQPAFERVVQPSQPQPEMRASFQPSAPAPSSPQSFEPVAVAQSPGYAPSAPGKSILGKVLLVVGGIVFALFVLGVAGAVYGAYWVKHKVQNFTSAVAGGSSSQVKVVASGDSCRLLPAAEVQQVLGIPIEKSAEIVEGTTPGCAYYASQESFSKLQKMALEQARQQADEVNKRPGPKPDNLPALMKETNEMEGIVKTLGLTQAAQDGRVFSFTLQRGFGESSWSGMRIAESAVPGFEEVRGVGDHAMIGSFVHAFYTIKGDAMIQLDTTYIPDAKVRGSLLSRKIISNL